MRLQVGEVDLGIAQPDGAAAGGDAAGDLPAGAGVGLTVDDVGIAPEIAGQRLDDRRAAADQALGQTRSHSETAGNGRGRQGLIGRIVDIEDERNRRHRGPGRPPRIELQDSWWIARSALISLGSTLKGTAPTP